MIVGWFRQTQSLHAKAASALWLDRSSFDSYSSDSG